jgi:hypothetical protein
MAGLKACATNDAGSKAGLRGAHPIVNPAIGNP